MLSMVNAIFGISNAITSLKLLHSMYKPTL
jgi:hypothetical protein